MYIYAEILPAAEMVKLQCVMRNTNPETDTSSLGENRRNKYMDQMGLEPK
jgi:hypothetical protein